MFCHLSVGSNAIISWAIGCVNRLWTNFRSALYGHLTVLYWYEKERGTLNLFEKARYMDNFGNGRIPKFSETKKGLRPHFSCDILLLKVRPGGGTGAAGGGGEED